jgi:transketolase
VTYLAFADYERPAMRMAALMGLPVKFVFGHDSIGIGKNGPTHQPVEILASLAGHAQHAGASAPPMPSRPPSAGRSLLEHRSGPSTLVFARQALPHVRTVGGARRICSQPWRLCARRCRGGAASASRLLATGSEVVLALAARRTLQAAGSPTAVVSMPSWELFEMQPVDYRMQVLGPGTVRVAVRRARRPVDRSP